MKISFEKFEGNNALNDLNDWFKQNQSIKIINIETSLTYSDFGVCYKVWFFVEVN